MNKPFPAACIALAFITVIASSAVAVAVNGQPWSTVPILSLRHYGGVDNAQLAAGEWWRLLTAQFVHVRPAHMAFNVVALLVVGAVVEQNTSSLSFLLLWLMSGVTGMLTSIYHVAPPYDIGSGGSQALMGIVAAAAVLMLRNRAGWRWRGAVILTLLIQLALDIASAHRPQPGHVVGFVVGFVLAIGIMPRPIRPRNSSVA